MSTITLTVNGRAHTVDVEPSTPLLYVLSDDLALRGPKFGCGLGQCGACTVIARGRAVRSCVTPMSTVSGADITTLEGLGTPEKPHPIQQAFIGTCTGGRLADLEAAAQVVKGQKLRCRLVVIPASSEVLLAATQNGTLATLIEAGAAINTPGCGPCMGNHMGVPAPNEVTISSGSRNFKGRMGDMSAKIFMGSPATVAASALKGVIADPREFLH